MWAANYGYARQAEETIMNVALWIAQVLLAAAFATSGVMKTSMPIAALAQSLKWAGDLPPALVRLIGACELAGAIGVVVPSMTRMKPTLTPLAAGGLVLMMILASLFHITRGEVSALPFTGSLGALAAFVAWGRLWRAPVASSSSH